MLEEHLRVTGDNALRDRLSGVIDRLLAWFERQRGKEGLLTAAPEWNFIDWVDLDPASELACLNLQYLMALRAVAVLEPEGSPRRLKALGDATMLSNRFDDKYWDEERGLYRDAPGLYSAHTNILALLALPCPAIRARRIVAEMSKPGLKPTYSPYFDGYLLRALCRHGLHDKAMDLIRTRWGAMIDSGATTFWETYGGEWSLCHAWSCTPVAILLAEIAGVTFDASIRTIRFAPRPAGLKQIEARMTLPCGPIATRIDVEPGGLSARFLSPEGFRLEVDFPAREGDRLVADVPLPAEVHEGRLRTALRSGNLDFRVTAGR
jgi:hypothetical protein